MTEQKDRPWGSHNLGPARDIWYDYGLTGLTDLTSPSRVVVGDFERSQPGMSRKSFFVLVLLCTLAITTLYAAVLVWLLVFLVR